MERKRKLHLKQTSENKRKFKCNKKDLENAKIRKINSIDDPSWWDDTVVID